MNAPNHDDRETDPVWRLLDQAKPPEAGPFFVRNVMREIRLAAGAPDPWWRRLLGPKPLAAGALAAAAAVLIVANLDPAAPPPAPVGVTPPEPATAPAVEAFLEEELLLVASEDPSVFSDEQLLDLLY